MSLKKEEISSGDVRYYDTPTSVAQVLELYSAEEISEITSFSIHDSKLAEVSGLGALANVEHLSIGNCQIGAIGELQQLSKLSTLCLDDNALSRIEGFGETPAIRLDAQNNALESLSAIEPSQTLSWLNVNGCKLSNLHGLERFPSLTTLTVYGNPITALDTAEHENLEVLKGKELQIESTEGLRSFPGLKNVELGDTIRVIADLEHLPKLEKVHITGPIEHITPESLEVLVRLLTEGKKVSLYGSDDVYDRFPSLKLPPKNEIRDGRLSFRANPMTFEGMANLYSPDERASVTSLSLPFCELTDTKGLELFPNVESLSLEKNPKLHAVEGLGETRVTTLDTSGSGISSVADVATSSTLEEWNAERSALETLNGLHAFVSLKELNLERCENLRDINPGATMESVETLLLRGCELESMEGWSEWYPNLKKLVFKDNPCPHVCGLEGFDKLEWVELDSEPESATPESIAKILEMRAEGKRAQFGFGFSEPGFMPQG